MREGGYDYQGRGRREVGSGALSGHPSPVPDVGVGVPGRVRSGPKGPGTQWKDPSGLSGTVERSEAIRVRPSLWAP